MNDQSSTLDPSSGSRMVNVLHSDRYERLGDLINEEISQQHSKFTILYSFHVTDTGFVSIGVVYDNNKIKGTIHNYHNEGI